MGCLKLEQGSDGNKSLVRIRELEVGPSHFDYLAG